MRGLVRNRVADCLLVCSSAVVLRKEDEEQEVEAQHDAGSRKAV